MTMIPVTQTDPLAELLQLCDGDIYLSVNDHLSSYRTVKDHLNSRSMYSVIPQITQQRMIEADCFVILVFTPIRADRETVRLYGADVWEVLSRACGYIRQKKYLVGPSPATGVNTTRLLDELIATCKGEVILNLNEFKGKWHRCLTQGYIWDATAKDFFANMEEDYPERFVADKDGEYEISPAERQAMEELDQSLHVQFYPNTPVGFYDWYDTDLGDMLERAVTVAKQATRSTMERSVEILAESKLT